MREGRKILAGDYAREPVPYSKRRGWIPLALIWLAMGIDLSAVVLGAALVAGMTLKDAIIAVSVGSFVLGVIGALCSYVGAATNLSTAMINRFTFGEKGSLLVIIPLTVAMFGWFGVTAGFFGESAHVVLKSVVGLDLDPMWLALIGGLLMTVTATIGYQAIEKLSVLAVPLMMGFLGAMMFKLAMNEDLGALLDIPPKGPEMGIGTAISLVVGAFIIACSQSPDVARWAKSSKHAVLSGFFGFLIGNSLMMYVAALLSRMTGTEDVIQILLSIGWGAIAVILLILAQWTTNDNNMYSVGLNLSILFKGIPKPVLTVTAGLMGTSLAVMGIYDKFVNFLILLGPFAAPVAGIYLMEFFILNPDKFKFAFIKHQKIPAVRWHALVVWALATFVGFSTTPVADGGPGWITITHVPVLDGLLSAMLLQWIAAKIVDGKKSPALPESPDTGV